MITADGWFDWAIREPGPPDKKYTEPCKAMGIVFHSAVGYYNGWKSRLFSTERLPNGKYTPYAAASVTGFIRYDGTLYQHYPITASCWGSGNRHANTTFDCFEVEGGYQPHDEPWRPAQLATGVRITKELSELKGWVPKHEDRNADTLLRHRQCVRIWGGAPTACDSFRANLKLIAELSVKNVEEPDMTDEQLKQILDTIKYVGVSLKNQTDDQNRLIAAIAKNLDDDHKEIVGKLDDLLTQGG